MECSIDPDIVRGIAYRNGFLYYHQNKFTFTAFNS